MNDTKTVMKGIAGLAVAVALAITTTVLLPGCAPNNDLPTTTGTSDLPKGSTHPAESRSEAEHGEVEHDREPKGWTVATSGGAVRAQVVRPGRIVHVTPRCGEHARVLSAGDLGLYGDRWNADRDRLVFLRGDERASRDRVVFDGEAFHNHGREPVVGIVNCPSAWRTR